MAESTANLVQLNEVLELEPTNIEEDLDCRSDPTSEPFPSGDDNSSSTIHFSIGEASNHIDDKLAEAIKTGHLKVVTDWLATFQFDDEKKTKLNTAKYNDSSTALHLAAEYNQPTIAKLFLDEGADPNTKKTYQDGYSALHIACSNSFDSEIVQLLVERNCDVDATDDNHTTPLHVAAQHNHTSAMRILLENGADMQLRDDNGDQPIHVAAEKGHHGVVELLVEKNAECVHWISEDNQTPLHRVCTYSHNIQTAEFLINKGANVNAEDDDGDTPLLCASDDHNNTELVKLLLEAGAEVNPPLNVENSRSLSPLQTACYHGCNDIVSVLLKHGAKIDSEALEKAVSEGYEEIVKQLIEIPEWPLLMRHTFIDSQTELDTTPFREMIKKMPDVAEEILNKCTVYDPMFQNPEDEDYSVIFNYEFIEDFRDDNKGIDDTDSQKTLKKNQRDEKHRYGSDYETISEQEEHSYSSSWGPVGFKKASHPLAIMVDSKRLNLLTHPLVGSLLHHKWKKFGQYGYFANLLTYCVFLIFLTTFAFIIQNPRSQACSSVSMNINGTRIDCGISTVHLIFIYFSAIGVVILSLCRLVLEGIQFITQRSSYILDWVNWMEIVIFVCSIIFVWVFHVDCLCPLTWQWQIGVVAVFLGWVGLIVFISKFPLTGIYVLMFVKILYTFLKMLILSVLLVLAFGLTFYLAFTQPEILRSPFSNPGRSILKTMTMAAGEFDFDIIFRQDPTGGSDNAEEIPFPPISYILWIVFIIIMPILLTNMLVGLAVGDIQNVRDEAALQKLALQIEQVLTVEELLPRKLRQHFTSGYKEVYPNHKVSWRKKFLFIVWGGDRYDTRASIGKVLHPHEDENEKLRKKTDKLLHEVEDMKHLLKQLVTKLEARESAKTN